MKLTFTFICILIFGLAASFAKDDFSYTLSCQQGASNCNNNILTVDELITDNITQGESVALSITADQVVVNDNQDYDFTLDITVSTITTNFNLANPVIVYQNGVKINGGKLALNFNTIQVGSNGGFTIQAVSSPNGQLNIDGEFGEIDISVGTFLPAGSCTSFTQIQTENANGINVTFTPTCTAAPPTPGPNDYSGQYDIEYGCSGNVCIISGTATVNHVGNTVHVSTNVQLGKLGVSVQFSSGLSPVSFSFNNENFVATSDGQIVTIATTNADSPQAITATCTSGPCLSITSSSSQAVFNILLIISLILLSFLF